MVPAGPRTGSGRLTASIAVLLTTVLLSACTSLSEVRPGRGRTAQIAGPSYDQIWAAVRRIAARDFKILQEERDRGLIRAERTRYLPFNGEWIAVYIMPPVRGAAQYSLEVVARKKSVVAISERSWEKKVMRDVLEDLAHQRGNR